MAERLSRREKGVSDFVPTNVAVNFVQHNRCNGHIFRFMRCENLQLCNSFDTAEWVTTVTGSTAADCTMTLISHQQKGYHKESTLSQYAVG